MKRIHFIAVGGAVMHQLAIALHLEGYVVTGSDDEIHDPARSNLAAAGILPESAGWFPGKITAGLDAVVLGMHARSDNPELLAAQALKVPVYSFPEYIYQVSKNKKRVVIAGSHGKTTITSMIMHVLREQGMRFDYLVGARVEGFSQSVQLTDAPVIILEGDEYPASVVEKRPKIFFYHPHIAVLSGIAWDHINVFPTYENYRSQFEAWLRGMEPGGALFYNNEDSEVRQVAREAGEHLRTQPYFMPRYHYRDGVAVLETDEGPQPVSVFGSHNLLNMQAALAVCTALGVPQSAFYRSVASFTGAARRLERLYERKGLVVFRDFAHAPSKLEATLNAVREAYPSHELIACFELHTFSSLSENFLREYRGSMDAADRAIVYFSHHALELKGLPALEKAEVKQCFGREDLSVSDEREELAGLVKAALGRGSKPVCLLLMSSGTFDGIDWNNVVSQ